MSAVNSGHSVRRLPENNRFQHAARLNDQRAAARILGVGVAASLVTASAQLPERTDVREESEHCREAEWQVSQALSTELTSGLSADY